MSEAMRWEKAPEASGEMGTMYALHDGVRRDVGLLWHTLEAEEIAAHAYRPLQWGPAQVRCDGVEATVLALTGSPEPGEGDVVAVFVTRPSMRAKVAGLEVPQLDGHELPPLPGVAQ